MDYPKILDEITSHSQAEAYVLKNFDLALSRTTDIFKNFFNSQGECNKMSLNGIIGGKNYTYDCTVENYSSHIKYYISWREGHLNDLNRFHLNMGNNSALRISKMLEDEFLEEFIAVYLSRTYFKKTGK